MLFASLLGGERQRSVLEGAVMWNWRLGSGGMIEGEAWRGSQESLLRVFLSLSWMMSLVVVGFGVTESWYKRSRIGG